MSVVLDLEGKEKKLGTLAWSGKERRAYFEYTAEFLVAPLLVSPFHLMAAPGLFAGPRDPFDGLHGRFNDSLPDGWGRLLLDRRLQHAGIDYNWALSAPSGAWWSVRRADNAFLRPSGSSGSFRSRRALEA